MWQMVSVYRSETANEMLSVVYPDELLFLLMKSQRTP
jgi:hypothetical protein